MLSTDLPFEKNVACDLCHDANETPDPTSLSAGLRWRTLNVNQKARRIRATPKRNATPMHED